MRVAFAYGRYALGDRKIDLRDPEGSPTGLTGSEWSCLALAREMKKRGHDVTLYWPHRRPYEVLPAISWEGVRLRELTHLKQEYHDAVCAWNEPDLLRDVPPGSLRLCNQQLNDFWYATLPTKGSVSDPGYDAFVDIYTSPSESHRLHLRDQTPSPGKWVVLPNGVDPELYPATKKVPGRCIYASSPDRGLHHLLALWPVVRKKVREAHLRVFYDLNSWLQLAGLREDQVQPRHLESRRRAMEVINVSQGGIDGVEIVGPVSRRRMTRELSEATCLAYPCDPYTWTEGFSVTTMEACAAGTVPVISSADALTELYSSSCPMVMRPKPGELSREDYTDLLIRVLKDEKTRAKVLPKTLALAKKYSWESVTGRLEKILERKTP